MLAVPPVVVLALELVPEEPVEAVEAVEPAPLELDAVLVLAVLVPEEVEAGPVVPEELLELEELLLELAVVVAVVAAPLELLVAAVGHWQLPVARSQPRPAAVQAASSALQSAAELHWCVSRSQ